MEACSAFKVPKRLVEDEFLTFQVAMNSIVASGKQAKMKHFMMPTSQRFYSSLSAQLPELVRVATDAARLTDLPNPHPVTRATVPAARSN